MKRLHARSASFKRSMQLAKYKFHYKETIRLGIPIMLGQLGIIVVGFADNIMVGHHSTIELAAASFVNNFFNLAFICGMGFSYGLTPIIGGLFANHNYRSAGEYLKNSFLINAFVGVVLSLLMLLLMFNIGSLGQPQELMPYIIPYYILQLSSVVFVMLFNSFKQFSDGTTDTLTPMWIMLGGNVLNIIGNYILIYGKLGAPELGLTGAGISTLLSRIVMAIAAISFLFYHSKYTCYLEGFKTGAINKLSLEKLMRLGFPVSFLMGVETASFSLSVVMMGWIGSIALAAHQIVGVITTLGFMIYYGIGAALTIRISGYKSKKDMVNIRNASYAALHITLGVAFFVMALIYLLREEMGYLFTNEIEVIELVALLALPVILYQIGDGIQILFANALRGISDVKYMAYAAFCCHFGLALPLGYICGFVLGWGPLGVWCGFPISLTVLGILLWRRFNKLTKIEVS